MFLLFLWLYLWFSFILLRGNLPKNKIFIAHRIQRNTNFEHGKDRVCKSRLFFILFLQISVFYRCEKTDLTDFAQKRALIKVKYLRLLAASPPTNQAIVFKLRLLLGVEDTGHVTTRTPLHKLLPNFFSRLFSRISPHNLPNSG